MAELFGVETHTVNYHLKEIFKSGELEEMSVIRNFRITAADGKNYNTQFYNLDAIIAVGYRVNSHEATRFRIWATKTLKEFTGVQLKWYKSSEMRYSTGFFLQKFRNWQNYCRHAENPWYKMGYVVQWL